MMTFRVRMTRRKLQFRGSQYRDPILPGAEDANDSDVVLARDVHDQVAAVGMDANWWCELGVFSRDGRESADDTEDANELVDVGVSLVK